MEELKTISEKEFKIILAGYNANRGYSKNADELEKAINTSSISENTTLIEFISRDDIPSLYNKCDAFIMTSVQEGLPVSALEASMSGLPVFSTRCGGVEDYVDNTMGRIVSVTDYKSLARHCNDFLNGDITFDPLHIRKKAISMFGKQAFIENVATVVDELVSKNNDHHNKRN
jgi:glycosyltransferase involved in cell wall biosynthesis